MEMSESITDLAAALAKAQGQIEFAKKDSANPHFKSKYADLASVWEACREALSSNGLSVVQAPGPCVDNRMTMTTMLMHSSGQWIREILTIPLSKVDAQGYGSATTYARRYSLAAMVGIVQDDDDGNAASNPKGASNEGGRDASRVIDKKQLAELQKLVSDTGSDAGALCDHFKIGALPDLPADKFNYVKGVLEKRLPEQKEAA